MDTICLWPTGTGWRWTRRNANGLITGAATEEYVRQEDARHNIETTQKEPYNLVVADGDVDPNDLTDKGQQES